ncbi:MAG TPA: DsbE family thiol:disulfide interchange protein [Alphaproteobacteria bacterium]|nr:DsbE family thiol:disulfide interchange protein [Alphaproteobacteria bacterium]
MPVAKRLIFLLPALLFLALAAAFYLRIGHDPSVVPSALIDKPAPSFSLPPLLGGKPGLASDDLKGHVVLVNVFASWCVPCRAEHPLLARLAEAGVTLYGIDYKDKPEEARRWLAELGDPYARIGADADGQVAINWGVYGVPETFVVDRNGIIRFKQVGPFSDEIVNDTILPMVRKLSQ